ncbi:MAG: phenylalanine--tRNA ligase subunit beta, partial [Chlamydiia bacterium]|nr:phenylalanine--tRNA ligase subunit beta [Chlamydiia bacterium]
HPNADKLSIAKVTDGKQEWQVVCGAPNCRAGITAAFAPEGAHFSSPGCPDMTITRRKIRGVESVGMLCSSSEIGIEPPHDVGDEGILELDDSFSVGTDLVKALTDSIFEISLTPNFAHCASIMGVARELAAAYDLPFKDPLSLWPMGNENPSHSDGVSLEVQDPDQCPRYSCRVIRNVVPKPSPFWLRYKLYKCGCRSINTIVDATNLILYATGQPLHAFDLANLAGNKVVVRAAKEGECMMTLDERERTLEEGMLLICDAEKPVALAGVMGGANSVVTDETRDLLIESAYFSPSGIRRTSKRLSIMTDSSRRFERGCDPNAPVYALRAVTALIHQLSGGEVESEIIDALSERIEPRRVSLRVSRVNQLLGLHLGVGEVESTFKRLGFYTQWDGKNTFSIDVPTYRIDIKEEIDLVEEVARFYGYEKFPRVSPRYHGSTLPHVPIYTFEQRVRNCCLGLGLQELLTCDLIGPESLGVLKTSDFKRQEPIRVLNPSSIEQSVLRQSLLPGLLQVVKLNADHGNRDLAGFEIGKIHFKNEGQYREELVLGLVLVGRPAPHYWGDKDRNADFYDLKGVVEDFLSGMGVVGECIPSSVENFHPGRQTSIVSEGLAIGAFGEIHPEISQKLDVDGRIYFAEISLTDLFHSQKPLPRYKSVPQYPSSTRDWTATLHRETPIGNVLTALQKEGTELLAGVELLYLYRDPENSAPVVNATFRLTYQDRSRTVQQEEVDSVHFALIDKIGNHYSQGQGSQL